MAEENVQGIVINEIFATPDTTETSSVTNPSPSDTNRNGTVEPGDEFIELFNTNTSGSVDISDWTIRRADATGSYTFPGNSNSGTVVIPAGEKLVLVTAKDPNVDLPNGYFNIGENLNLDNWRSSETISLIPQGQGGSAEAVYGGTNNFSETFSESAATPGQSFDRDPDGSNTIVEGVPNPECFLTGTRVLTESGYKLVEELKIGDKVQTAEGNFAAVKWIGYQTVNPVEIGNPLRANPVLIKAGALSNNLPSNDLYLSPDHALLVDGLLINAGALVNDISIIKTEPTETFVYHSIELANHALLMVEGTYAESYMPHHEDRANYDNGAEYEELYPNGSNLMLWPMDYPRVSSMNKVPCRVSQKLMAIAEQLTGKVLSCA